jgi:hypothetical protein
VNTELLEPPGSFVEKDSVKYRKGRLLAVVAFAVAMAWVESATVAYLRTLLNRVEPYQERPLPIVSLFGGTELAREAATVVMLLSVAWLAGKTWKGRCGYFMVAFGVWDIFYYVFLKIIVGWPHSLFDWDVLFLIPLPWWGPVLSPVLISIILIIGGILMSHLDGIASLFTPSRASWVISAAGLITALYVFMATAIQGLLGDSHGIHNILPTQFNWLVFDAALLMLSAPIIEIAILFLKGGRNAFPPSVGE